MRLIVPFLLCSILLLPSAVFSRGNTKIETYQQAKKVLYQVIYRDHRITFYCNFPFEKNRFVRLPDGFIVPRHPDRANRVETEHVVPVENFGKAFPEWREGHEQCVADGRPFKGRKCVELVNEEFRRMESDLHNLYPSVGVVNAMRGNKNFQMFGPSAALPFGPTCPMRMENRSVEPPKEARGPIARTYLYMEATYQNYHMSSQQRRLMEAWDREYPPTEWECERARRIRKVQGNGNSVVEDKCPKE